MTSMQATFRASHNAPFFPCLEINSKVAELRAGIFNGLESLMELYLHDNKISNIEMGQFSNLTKCTILSLSQNKLTYLRVGLLDGLESVTQLYLHHNRISDVEMFFF